jgi:alpha-tubulin suppressor-like RCC1 family protein
MIGFCLVYFIALTLQSNGLGNTIIHGGGSGLQMCITNQPSGITYCFGKNMPYTKPQGGLLGDGTQIDKSLPTPVHLVALDVISASVGRDQSCFLKSTGSVMCTGFDGYGGLGNDVFIASVLEPVLVTGLTAPAKQIATGGSHSCALLSAPNDGAVMCWGNDHYGQLSNGGNGNSAIPLNVTNYGVGSTKFIAASRRNTCLVSTSGGVFCAGYDYYLLGRCGVYSHSNVMLQIPGLISGYETVAMGAYHACALPASGSVVIC